MSFAGSIAGWVVETKTDLDRLLRATAYEAAYRIVQNTPVDTGFLRGSWTAVLGRNASPRAGKVDPGGGRTLGDMSVTLQGAKWGDVITLVNGANYAMFIEYGTARMRARPMVRPIIAQIEQIVAEQAARLQIPVRRG